MSGSHLRICLVASARFPVAEPFMGGMEAHTHALALALRTRGHDVSVFAAPGSDPRLGVQLLPVSRFEPSAAARADVGRAPQQWLEEHHAYLGLMLRLAAGEHGRFDVVHNNSLHHLPLAMSPMLEAPLVTTLHTPPVDWLESAIHYVAPTATFVAVSHSVALAWSHVARARTIHNGVDTETWVAGPGGGPAVWSGRLVPEKAPHEAVLAAARAGLDLDLAGPVHDPAYFESHVRPLLGEGRRYLGHLSTVELRELVGRASVAVVSPRWEEPFGLVAAEALACGTPVAAYGAGALREIVDERTGCLVPAGDVAALARAMHAARSLDRAHARRRAVAHFSQRAMVDGYERVYREVAGMEAAA